SLRSPSSDLPLLTPDREDHVAAAEIFTRCRRAGVQLGTIDALIVQLCRRHDVTLLTTDGDFALAARHIAFKRWR
ncbi:MAG: PIN domain-containing protein, partial [Myxococcaceae bacterium]|nr:PIN domain-containing protein [Myxococcaceae bacterium]